MVYENRYAVSTCLCSLRVNEISCMRVLLVNMMLVGCVKFYGCDL